MFLSDFSVRRPVVATVISMLLVAFGALSFLRLPLREYPDVNPPVVSIETAYRGASAHIVETRITEVLEDSVSGIEGIRSIESVSQDGESEITIEFTTGRDIDAAANDIRDRVSRVIDNLPEEADPPEIAKVDANNDVILWLNLASDEMTSMELTDYAERYLVDRLAVVDGVARVRVGGGRRYAMRIWLDRKAMAARELTVADVEAALRRSNVELPAGRIESLQREFTVRVERQYQAVADFNGLVIAEGDDGYLVRLGEIARVEIGPADERSELRGNGEPMIGLGIIRQSTANTLAVARGVKTEVERINDGGLPGGMYLDVSYDTSQFIEEAVNEVFIALLITAGLVVFVIFLFLGSVRSVLVPAVTVPVSLVASFIVLYALDFSANLLTLLALVLAIGLVVDDAIVVLENVHRRVRMGEKPLLAAFRGARQVGFAVIATTTVLIAVFVPISFMTGNIGRLFTEFAFAMAAAVAFSSLVALTLSPMMCSKLMSADEKESAFSRHIQRNFDRLGRLYQRVLGWCVARPVWIILVLGVALAGTWWLMQRVPNEFAPGEDRGAFFVLMRAPEGASFEYSREYMLEIENRTLPLIDSGEATRVLIRTPGSFGTSGSVNSGIAIIVLAPWEHRRPQGAIIGETAGKVAGLPGVRAFPFSRQGLGQGRGQPVQFVIGGPSYGQLAEWRDVIIERARENPGLQAIDSDFQETKPQLQVEIDTDRAADLGVPIDAIGRALETMLGSRRVTTWIDRGEEYDIILQGRDADRQTPDDLANIHVRSTQTAELIPLSNLVHLEEVADASQLNRFNRLRAITITANLADGYTLGEALRYLEGIVRDELPGGPSVDFKGQSREFRDSESSLLFVFGLALLVVYLVLAAQFESFIHPFVIMLTVPLAVGGALFGLWWAGSTLNVYSQIGLIMLIGLSAKNGILIVEFANQLRDTGRDRRSALLEAAHTRLRPILMTTFSTAIGALPLVLASGAGSESRFTIGVVIFSGVLFSSVLTLFIVPVAYDLLGRLTGSPGQITRELEALHRETPDRE